MIIGELFLENYFPGAVNLICAYAIEAEECFGCRMYRLPWTFTCGPASLAVASMQKSKTCSTKPSESTEVHVTQSGLEVKGAALVPLDYLDLVLIAFECPIWSPCRNPTVPPHKLNELKGFETRQRSNVHLPCECKINIVANGKRSFAWFVWSPRWLSKQRFKFGIPRLLCWASDTSPHSKRLFSPEYSSLPCMICTSVVSSQTETTSKPEVHGRFEQNLQAC